MCVFVGNESSNEPTSSKPNLRPRQKVPHSQNADTKKRKKRQSETSQSERGGDLNEDRGAFAASFTETLSFQANPIHEPQTLKEFVRLL